MTKRNDLFSALAIAAFGVAAYADGGRWASGFCIGIATAWACIWLLDYLNDKDKASDKPSECK